ncbi:MAG: hydroxymethylbilane synthase [Candidatus Cyclobacteriaceae bacterium M3_2C_046]
MKSKIRIGTRGSKLALWQAYQVEGKLQAGGVDTEIIPIDTKGDKILEVAIGKIGSKGVFTEEIEEQLLTGAIDLAVHSAKDLQSELPEGFEIIAFTEREKAHDVLVSFKRSIRLENPSPDYLIGTSSTRRVAFLKHYYPHLHHIAVRGNLQTRIRKLEEGQADALLLAYAGVHRMEFDHLIVQELPLDHFIPAVGQGTVAVEVSRALDPEKRALIRQYVNHEPTEKLLLAERAFLRKLQGGCSIPAFALARWNKDQLTMSGGIVSLDGQKMVSLKLEDSPDRAAHLGTSLAEMVLQQGGAAILKAIRGNN